MERCMSTVLAGQNGKVSCANEGAQPCVVDVGERLEVRAYFTHEDEISKWAVRDLSLGIVTCLYRSVWNGYRET